MTTRRQFLRGAVSAAVAASLPASDGVELTSIAHPLIHTGNPAPALLPMVTDLDTGMFSPSADKLSLVTGGRYAGALSKSMMETMEQVSAKVYSRKVFNFETAFDLSSLEEIEVDIKRGGSTDETEGDV